MLIKKNLPTGYSAILVGLLALMMFNCNKNDDDPILDTTDPTITVTSPTQAQFNAGFEAGSTITLTGTVTDNDLVQSVRFRLNNAAGVTILDEQMNNINQQTVNINQTIPIPAATPEGNYSLVIDATDREGNTGTFTQTFAIRPSGTDGTQVTFNVTVPESTPANANVHIVGAFNDWDPGDDDYILDPVEGQENMYTITLNWEEGTEYKFTLGSWERVEKDEDCEEIDDREFTPAAESHEIDVIVENWAGLGPCGEDVGEQVTFNVTVPQSTPEGATIYLSGPFNDWDPADEDYLLTQVEGQQNRYTITLSWQQPTEYKYTLGSFENVEKDANCEDIDNRQFTPATEAQEINDTVENWAGYGNCPADEPVLGDNILVNGELTSDEGWTVYETENPATNTEFTDDGLIFSNTGAEAQSDITVWQAVEVEAGQTYQISANVSGNGTIASWVQIMIGRDEPVDGQTYWTDNFDAINFLALDSSDAETGCGTQPFNGNIADLACQGDGVGENGMITFNEGGTIYFVIKAGSWEGNLGEGGVTITDVSMRPVIEGED